MDEPSIFTRIVNREVPAHILHEDARVIVFLSLENHPLVVPKAPVRDIFALDDETAAAVMQTAVRVARALRDALGCDGVYLSQANGAAAGLSTRSASPTPPRGARRRPASRRR